MSDIPTKAFNEILRRLPTAALPQFRLVCKAWKHKIDGYLRLQPRNNHLILRDDNGKLYSIPLTSLCFSGAQTVKTEFTILKKIIRKGIPIMPELPLCSCHGLILLWSYKIEKDWAVWNPFTKYCIQLPPFDHIMDPDGLMTRGGLGYDQVTDDYKVVRISQIDVVCGDDRRRTRGLETLIYSMKSDEWRRIADYADCLVAEAGFGVFANGAINWIMFVNPGGGRAAECIVSLDLSSERYRQFPMPLDENKHESYDYSVRLDSLNDCLFLSYSYAEKFDVWMMKECDGESRWMNFVSIRKVFGVGMYLMSPKLVAYVESARHVLIENGGKLLWFDMESKRGKIIEIDGIEGTVSCQAFPVCHFRLPGDGGAVESVASLVTLKRKRQSMKRLRLTLTATTVCFSRD